jgi:hypothetical protein
MEAREAAADEISIVADCDGDNIAWIFFAPEKEVALFVRRR